MTIILSYPPSASERIVLLKTPPIYYTNLLDFIVSNSYIFIVIIIITI